uniref:Uncharacterized protein n=1 Tax=Solanum tuberosum TaxID=4113 RepID=M1DUS6_SOLTU
MTSYYDPGILNPGDHSAPLVEIADQLGDPPFADHSAPLVEITNQLGDPPFGRFHHRLVLSFSIVVFSIIGRHSTTSRKCLATCRLLFFTADLIPSFMGQHTGTKGEDKTFWRLAEWVR